MYIIGVNVHIVEKINLQYNDMNLPWCGMHIHWDIIYIQYSETNAYKHKGSVHSVRCVLTVGDIHKVGEIHLHWDICMYLQWDKCSQTYLVEVWVVYIK